MVSALGADILSDPLPPSMNTALQPGRPASVRQRLIAGGLFLAACLYLVPFVDRGWVPLDEGMMGQAAERVLAGELPHVDYEESYPGALSYLYAGVFRVFGIDAVHLRWTVFGGAIAGLAVLYQIVRRFQPPIAAAVTTIVSLVWTYPNYISSLPSWWVLLCALICVGSVFRYIETGRTSFVVLAGLSSGIAFTLKQTGLYLLPPLVMSLMLCPAANLHATPARLKFDAALRAATALGGTALVILLTRSGLGAGELVYLVGPVAASCAAFLLWTRSGEGEQPINWHAPVLAVACAAVPVLVLMLPHIVAGRAASFFYGVFVLPQQRLQFTSLAMRPASQMVAAAVAMLWLLWSPASLSARELRVVNFVRWIVAVGLVLLALRSAVSYAVIWEGVRGVAALVPFVATWLLVNRRVADPRMRRWLFASSAVSAWLSLSQFPFAAPIYFCYVAPLGLIAGMLALTQAVPVRRLSDGPAIAAVLLFGLLSMNRGYVWNVGAFHQVQHLDAPLGLDRAHLRVSAQEAGVFGKLIPLVRQHLGDRGLVAGPDTPDVYFLSGQFSPSGRLFDFFSGASAASDDERMAEWTRADVIVLFHGSRFSPPPAASLVARLRAAFPQGESIPPFEVRWR
jgi:hypothetical protein